MAMKRHRYHPQFHLNYWMRKRMKLRVDQARSWTSGKHLGRAKDPRRSQSASGARALTGQPRTSGWIGGGWPTGASRPTCPMPPSRNLKGSRWSCHTSNGDGGDCCCCDGGGCGCGADSSGNEGARGGALRRTTRCYAGGVGDGVEPWLRDLLDSNLLAIASLSLPSGRRII